MNSYPRKRSRDADEQGATIREKRRPPRKVNPANPVKKLTTGLLETYKAINQVIASSAHAGFRTAGTTHDVYQRRTLSALLVQRESQRRWPLFSVGRMSCQSGVSCCRV
jgi:hypothetical protein